MDMVMEFCKLIVQVKYKKNPCIVLILCAIKKLIVVLLAASTYFMIVDWLVYQPTALVLISRKAASKIHVMVPNVLLNYPHNMIFASSINRNKSQFHEEKR